MKSIKWLSQFPEGQGDIFRKNKQLFFPTNNKNPRDSVYYHIWQIKAANPLTLEVLSGIYAWKILRLLMN